MTGGLLVAGTSSDAGKSMLVTGVCRWLARKGVRVAPFKAQNMSNNSAVALDGGEFGRAQALQAAACGLAPSVRFNPVLLKPGSDGSSQVVLHGQPYAAVTAGNFHELRPALAAAAFTTLARLREEYDVVICEGAGSPAEINLRQNDFVNMGLARQARLPVLLVGDIDRGGVFASFYGTLALLGREDQALLAGFVVNKFRGAESLLAPGLSMLDAVTGRPCYGVMPWHPGLWLDAEDSLSYEDGRLIGCPAAPHGDQWLRVAAVRLPRISNGTDLDALAVEPGVAVRLTTSPAEIAEADLVVLPGSKSTVDDLNWLRETGLASAIRAHVAAGRPLVGICGGYQMLAESIHDDVESGHGTVPGLGLLPVEVVFAREKTLRLGTGRALGTDVRGYEIHHGYESVRAGEPLIRRTDGSGEGAVSGSVFGTHWHGTFESDGYRRAFLARAARLAGRTGFEVAPNTVFAQRRERLLDLLGDLVEEHLDTTALYRLIESGPPSGLPFIPLGAPPHPSINRATDPAVPATDHAAGPATDPVIEPVIEEAR
jgi:adenosylcobyric acid synthase